MTRTKVSPGSVENGTATDTNFNEKTGEKSSTHQSFVQRMLKEKQDKKEVEAVSLRSLFRYAAPIDLFYMLLATLAAIGNGVAFPLLILVFGDLINTFTDRSLELCTLNFTALSLQYCPSGVQLTPSNFYTASSLCNLTQSNFSTSFDFKGQIRKQSLYMVAIGCCSILLCYLQVAFWSVPAERQTRVIRETLFRSILRKEISYFDQYKTGELSTQLTDNINKIHDGMGDKLGSVIQFIAAFISGIILGFVKGWKLTLVILSISPLLFISAMLLSKFSTSLTSMEIKAYGKAGTVAEEVLSAIRVVVAYNGQEREKHRYEQYLNNAKKMGIKKGIANGMTSGVVSLILYCAYALGFWYGAKLIRDGEYDIGTVTIVFFTIVFSVFYLGQCSPHLQTLAQARSAAYQVWKIIDTPSKIDTISQSGIKKDGFVGDIQFSNVSFTYPSRPDVKILQNLSFTVKSGQTIALVGSSGSGKSTCVQLLQRFYDCNAGQVCIDGTPVDQYNLKWLRQHIGVVSQEPVLFQGTIRENILFGFESATDQQVYEAAKMANAHLFITHLPDKYDRQVGERGATLSGGQKQRIAIARALIGNPRILLLDEATSALDNESEKIVQEALNRAAKNRTTVIVAHRLSTIRNADQILVMHKGEIVEEGDHHSLMQARGTYFNLVERQNLQKSENEEWQENTEESSINPVEEYSSRNSVLSRSDSVVIEAIKRNSIVSQNMPDGAEESETKKTEKRKNVAWTMFMMNKPEWLFIAFGCLACICNGALQPVYGLILSKLTVVFQECDEDVQARRVLLFALVFIGLGVVSLCAMFIQGFFFACSGEALTKRLRFKAFTALLQQETAYFDDPENNTGALCTRLATEASAVQGATGIRIGILLQNFSSLGAGLIISFVYSWELTLLVIAFIPLMILGGFLETRLISGFAKNDRKDLEDAGKISVAAIQNIRTVAQLTKEDYFYDEYSKLIQSPFRSSLKRAHVFGLFYSLTSSTVFFVMVALFMVGAHLVERNKVTFEDIMQVMNCLMFSAQSVGQTASLTPDYSKAINAASRILDLLDRKPSIDNGSREGKEIPDFRGNITFENVHFTYPTRSDSKILNNFQLKISAGQRVALVGSSGCGKSTSIQLIERFYDVNSGRVLADSEDIRNLRLQWYRSQIGIVFQEPVLFDMSIRENIAYGDNARDDISMEEIIQAAKDANIHDFIQCLPEGYETNCGAKGTQLSGGQKQRIAIARALIRNPKILLLDEATSALDSESEKIVQEALDRAQRDRTSITIAHRLSTIQNADVICLVHNGVVLESGRHQELIAQRGHYYRLALEKLQ